MKQSEITMIFAGIAGAVAVVLVVILSGAGSFDNIGNDETRDYLTFRGKIIDRDSPTECLRYYTDYNNADPYDSMVKAEAAMKFDRDC